MMDLDGTMKYLQGKPQNFTPDSVISEHDSRLVEPVHVIDGLEDAPVETPASILARFKSYGTFDKCDFSLSSCHGIPCLSRSL